MSNDEEKKKKKKRKLSRQFEENLPPTVSTIATAPGSDAPDELLPEEEIDTTDIELSWKWHAITYLVITAIVLALFFGYVRIMHNISVKECQTADQIMVWAATMENSEDKTEFQRINSEIEPELMELQKRIILLTKYCEDVERTTITHNIQDQVPRCEAVDSQARKLYTIIEKNYQPNLTNAGFVNLQREYQEKHNFLLEKIRYYLQTKDYGKNDRIVEAIEDYLPVAEQAAQIWNPEEVYKIAIEKYLDSIRFERTNKDAWLAISRAYQKVQWEDQALESYMRVIWIDRKGGNHRAEAFKDIETMINRANPYRDAMFYQAVGLCIIKEYTTASQSLKKFIEAQGNSIWVEEAQNLKKMTDTGKGSAIQKYLADDLWIHGRTTF